MFYALFSLFVLFYTNLYIFISFSLEMLIGVDRHVSNCLQNPADTVKLPCQRGVPFETLCPVSRALLSNEFSCESLTSLGMKKSLANHEE